MWSAVALGETYIEAVGRGSSREEALDTVKYRLGFFG